MGFQVDARAGFDRIYSQIDSQIRRREPEELELDTPTVDENESLVLDAVKPVFNDKGTILGFGLRTSMAPLLFQKADYTFDKVHKAISICQQFNRIIRSKGEEPVQLVSAVQEVVEAQEPGPAPKIKEWSILNSP